MNVDELILVVVFCHPCGLKPVLEITVGHRTLSDQISELCDQFCHMVGHDVRTRKTSLVGCFHWRFYSAIAFALNQTEMITDSSFVQYKSCLFDVSPHISPFLCADQFETSTSPPGIPRAFDCASCLGKGEFERCVGRVGNLNRIYLLFWRNRPVNFFGFFGVWWIYKI